MTPYGDKDATARELPWHFFKFSVGRKLSGIKAVCREDPATAKLPRPATPVGLFKGVTILKSCYQRYTELGNAEVQQPFFRNTKSVKGNFDDFSHMERNRENMQMKRRMIVGLYE